MLREGHRQGSRLGEQLVSSVWGVRVEGLWDLQVLWGPGIDIGAVGLPSHSYHEPLQLHSQGLTLFPGDSCCSVWAHARACTHTCTCTHRHTHTFSHAQVQPSLPSPNFTDTSLHPTIRPTHFCQSIKSYLVRLTWYLTLQWLLPLSSGGPQSCVCLDALLGWLFRGMPCPQFARGLLFIYSISLPHSIWHCSALVESPAS